MSLSYINACGITATNVSIGVGASTDGTYNVVIGSGAGANISSGAYNVVIGNGADVSGVSYCTVVGHRSAALANYATVIGDDVVNTVPNSCMIGNVAKPVSVCQNGAAYLRYTANGEFTSSSVTATAAQLYDGFILDAVPSASSYLYLPTAAQIVAAFKAPRVGATVCGYIGAYRTYGYNTATFVAGTGLTYYGPTSMYDGESAAYTLTLTNITPGAEACLMIAHSIWA